MPRRAAARLAAAAALAVAGPSAGAITADVTLRRLDEDRLRVEWVFSERIQGLEFPDGILGYRSGHWELDPGIVKLAPGTGDRIVAEGEWFERFSATVTMAPAYPEGHYVPFARFSDGGVAVCLGYFRGAALRNGLLAEDVHFRFRLVGREGEHTLLPPAANEDVSLFAYVGPDEPEDRGELRVLLDPAIPGWLDGVVSETLARVDAVYESRLGRIPRARPLVLIAAADLDTIDGWSVKGGAVHGAMIVITLRGRALHDDDAPVRSMMRKLVAHEVAHLWQAADPAGRANGAQPWLHEGAAEAMAVAALVDAGFWTTAQRDELARRMAETCAHREGELATAVCGGDWDAVYACGYGMFAGEGRDPFTIWNALVEESRTAGKPYHQGMLDRVLESR